MITLPIATSCPATVDYSRVRTFWACPDLLGVDLDPTAPVATRERIEGVIADEFARVEAIARCCGPVESIWLGDPMRDQVDWMDERLFYPVRVQYERDPPPQPARPFRVGPLQPKDDCQDEAFVQFCRGLELMKDRRWSEGLPLYELRWQIEKGRDLMQPFEYPYWDGTRRPGMKVLIWAEQGAGDVFQFCRYLHRVDFDADFCVFPELAGVIRDAGLPVKVIETFHAEYDYHIGLCSLPAALGLDPHEHYDPYLKADPGKVTRWKERLSGSHNVGIVWAGNQTHTFNTDRTIRLEQVIEQVPKGSAIYSLQKGQARDQLKYCPVRVGDFTDDLHNWHDTAALVDSLDEIVTVDTGMVHLAGAMGKPTTLLVSNSRDWRWPREGNRTPLYPSVRIVR